MELLKDIYNTLDENKAFDIKILDVRELTSVTDYFVIATGRSTKHASSLADYVEEALKDKGIVVSEKEGHRSGDWILLDYLDVVVNVFVKEVRDFYDLEGMWKDANIVEIH